MTTTGLNPLRIRGSEHPWQCRKGTAGSAPCWLTSGFRWLPITCTVLLLASIGAAIVASSFFSVPIEKMVAAEAERPKDVQ